MATDDPIDRLRRFAYPNPERIGCPGPEVFEAIKQRQVAFDDPVWKHIDECSPCYREFSEIRETLFRDERKSDIRKSAKTIVLMLFLFAAMVSYRIWQRTRPAPPPTSNGVEMAHVTLHDNEPTARGTAEEGTPPSISEAPHLPPKHLRLVADLPPGAAVGSYDLEILRADGERVWHGHGQAQSPSGGVMSVQVDADLSSIRAGEYTLQWRQSDNDAWRAMAVRVR